jgi:RimJ/RimL family protein N-acetyltransferase
MSNSSVPVLRTERLTLRGHRAEDFDDCFAMWSDPAVTRHIGGKPSTQSQTWIRLLSYIGHWKVMGFGYWVIAESATGRFAGEIGFADFKRDIAPSMKGVPELGFALAPAFHGKGYATEAVQAVLAWGDEHFSTPRSVCLISPENLASIRVAEKCGYKIFERAAFAGEPILFLERFAPNVSYVPEP